MRKIINKDIFIKIFNNLNYRQKLDKIILNFFGLDNNISEGIETFLESDIIIEFILFINKEYALNIIIKDTKKIFKSSKKFFINLSYREVNKYYELLMPRYWEIYCPYSLKYLKNNPKLLLVAALFSCKNINKVKKILHKLKIFNKTEIKDIMNIIDFRK